MKVTVQNHCWNVSIGCNRFIDANAHLEHPEKVSTAETAHHALVQRENVASAGLKNMHFRSRIARDDDFGLWHADLK